MDLLLGLGGVLVLSSVANLRRAYLSAQVSGTIVRRLRTEMFTRLQELPRDVVRAPTAGRRAGPPIH